MKTIASFFKTATIMAGGAVTLLVGLPSYSVACHDHPNPIAFPHPLSNDSELLPNGMMAIVYQHERGEQIIHITVHRIHMMMAGHHPRLPERRNPKYTVLQTNGTLNPMTYVIIKNALYYGTGRDAIGFPTKTWIDPEEDGLNGNEQASFQARQQRDN